MHGLSHQFPIAWEKAGKPIKWEKPGKLVPRKILQNQSYGEKLGLWYSYLSHSMGAFFPLDSHPMVYFLIGEIHGFLHQFSYSVGKYSEIHRIGRFWEIGNHFFTKVWVLFFHQIPILWYTLSHGKCMAFSINF